MNAHPQLDLTYPPINPARKRLLDEHDELRSWHRVADAHRVNVRYVYGYAVHNRIPHNRDIRRRLGIKRTYTINQMLSLPIQDMPPEILRWAFENREEIS